MGGSGWPGPQRPHRSPGRDRTEDEGVSHTLRWQGRRSASPSQRIGVEGVAFKNPVRRFKKTQIQWHIADLGHIFCHARVFLQRFLDFIDAVCFLWGFRFC